MKKTLIPLFLLPFAYYLLPKTAYAVCPVCTVAVTSGLGLSRYLGIDDIVSGVWFGGLIISSSFWLANWLKSKKINFKYLPIFTLLLFYLFTLIPLYLTNIIGHPFNAIMGIDKLVFGSLIGSVLFLLGMKADKFVRRKYGHQLFQFQKVIFPVISLVIGSIFLFIITRIKISFI